MFAVDTLINICYVCQMLMSKCDELWFNVVNNDFNEVLLARLKQKQ